MVREIFGLCPVRPEDNWEVSLAQEVSVLVAYLQERGWLTASGTLPQPELASVARKQGTRIDGEIDRRTLRTSRQRLHDVSRIAVAVSRLLSPRTNNPRAKGSILVTLDCGHTLRKPATQGNPQIGRQYACPNCSARPSGTGKSMK